MQQPVVGVDRPPGALVIHPGLRDVEVKRGEALLDQLDESPARPEPGALVEHRQAPLRGQRACSCGVAAWTTDTVTPPTPGLLNALGELAVPARCGRAAAAARPT